jgi:hypothetical protein
MEVAFHVKNSEPKYGKPLRAEQAKYVITLVSAIPSNYTAFCLEKLLKTEFEKTINLQIFRLVSSFVSYFPTWCVTNAVNHLKVYKLFLSRNR